MMEMRSKKSFQTRVERKRAERKAKFLNNALNIIKGYTLFKGGINLSLTLTKVVLFIFNMLKIALEIISSNLYYVRRNDNIGF